MLNLKMYRPAASGAIPPSMEGCRSGAGHSDLTDDQSEWGAIRAFEGRGHGDSAESGFVTAIEAGVPFKESGDASGCWELLSLCVDPCREGDGDGVGDMA